MKKMIHPIVTRGYSMLCKAGQLQVMKYAVLYFGLTCLSWVFSSYANAQTTDPNPNDPSTFVTTWTVSNNGFGKGIIFQGSGDYQINWGDGSPSESATGTISHTYTNAGTYKVTTSNGITTFKASGANGNSIKLTSY